MNTSEARNRSVSDWLQNVNSGTVQLPRFQRPQAWQAKKVQGMLATLLNNLPLGVALTLKTNASSPHFETRPIVGAPPPESRTATDLLLDGQQRLTAIWRSLHDDYKKNTYFISSQSEGIADSDGETRRVVRVTRASKNLKWTSNPAAVLKRELIPLTLLNPLNEGGVVVQWLDQALPEPSQNGDDMDANSFAEYKRIVDRKSSLTSYIHGVASSLKNFNLPFLELPEKTPGSTALEVFVSMNTNSKPLSELDILRAEVEADTGKSLDAYMRELKALVPRLAGVYAPEKAVVLSAALLQDRLPNSRGVSGLNITQFVADWPRITDGLDKTVDLLASMGIHDNKRLPSVVPLPVVATLSAVEAKGPDARGAALALITRYLWRAFFTKRYDRAAASGSLRDYRTLRDLLSSGSYTDGTSDLPDGIFDEEAYSLPSLEELRRAGWPNKKMTLARTIMAITYKLGAVDFAENVRLTPKNIGERQYHHVFPASILKEAGINPNLALNCALITGDTNRTISNKDPYDYLEDRYSWSAPQAVEERLATHLISPEDLTIANYTELYEAERHQRLAEHFEAFLIARARRVRRAMELLVEDHDLSAVALMTSTEQEV